MSDPRQDDPSVLWNRPQHELHYGGRWRPPKSGKYLETINPATGESLGRVAAAGAADVDAAVKAAHRAYAAWRSLKPAQRAAMLRAAASMLRDHAEELALIDALDSGNPVAEMARDVESGAAAYRRTQ